MKKPIKFLALAMIASMVCSPIAGATSNKFTVYADNESENAESSEDASETSEAESEEKDTVDKLLDYNDAIMGDSKDNIESLIEERVSEQEAAADKFETYRPQLVLGADLSEYAKEEVLAILGVTDESLYDIDTITHEEEVAQLGNVIPESEIGINAISSVLVNPLPTGSGISIGTVNIDYVTSSMYYSTLLTAGAKDIEVIIVAPSNSSGSAALAGVLKAYQNMTGEQIESDIIQVTFEQVALIERLSSKYGEEVVSDFFNKARTKTVESNNTNAKSLKEVVKALAKIDKLELEDTEIEELANVLAKLAKINIERANSNIAEPKYIEPKDFQAEFDKFTGTVRNGLLGFMFGDSAVEDIPVFDEEKHNANKATPSDAENNEAVLSTEDIEAESDIEAQKEAIMQEILESQEAERESIEASIAESLAEKEASKSKKK